ncbi:MAG: 4Fe-4S binding protein [Bacillota bacterium]|nr:4Fe-4S binding protein [Bacillota bacterium]
MQRQKPVKFDFSGKLKDVPLPIAVPGNLLSINAGFRSFRPVIDNDKCAGCMMCYVMCPDGTIYKEGEALAIDYDYCKGCGICAEECKLKAIEMVPEE